jgi:hypothetical protein
MLCAALLWRGWRRHPSIYRRCMAGRRSTLMSCMSSHRAPFASIRSLCVARIMGIGRSTLMFRICRARSCGRLRGGSIRGRLRGRWVWVSAIRRRRISRKGMLRRLSWIHGGFNTRWRVVVWGIAGRSLLPWTFACSPREMEAR